MVQAAQVIQQALPATLTTVISPALVFGALGALATFVTLIMFARNDGKREGKIESMKSAMQTRLDDFGVVLQRVNQALDEYQEFKREDAGWKAGLDGRMERAEEDIDRLEGRRA